MELVVLVKVVPRSEELRYDASRLAVAREGAELVLNPFDQRALRVALELRREGEHVTVVSLGPPAARSVLREACAVGADRALHLCDPAFAGSDVLATSTVLAAALRPIAADLVLAGARSTDSDTGLVGPEVAAHLGVPVVSLARAVRRPERDGPLEIVHETPRGTATSRLAPPAVVTVGEKIARPLHADESAFVQVRDDQIETIGPDRLGRSPAEVGTFASPTRVEAVLEVASRRLGRTFAEGPVGQRVRSAVVALSSLLQAPPSPPAALPWPPAFEAGREVVAVVSGQDGSIAPAAAGRITHLCRALGGYTIAAAAYGPTPTDEATRELERAGAHRGYLLDPRGAPFDSRDVARGLSTLLDTRPKLAALVLDTSPFGREVAGQLAAARQLGVIGDATDVRADPGGALAWTKPSFGGGTLATIRCRSSPVIATVPDGLEPAATDGVADPPLRWARSDPPPPSAAVLRTGETEEPLFGPSPDGARVVVAVGVGVGGPEGIARLRPALERWNAALVGTRRVVDAGWLPVRSQLGLTGRLLAPRVAVLLGVRGAPNHMVGWRRAGAIVAVNLDPEAPVFAGADVGIVGPVEEVVPELIEPLALATSPAVRA